MALDFINDKISKTSLWEVSFISDFYQNLEKSCKVINTWDYSGMAGVFAAVNIME